MKQIFTLLMILTIYTSEVYVKMEEEALTVFLEWFILSTASATNDGGFGYKKLDKKVLPAFA